MNSPRICVCILAALCVASTETPPPEGIQLPPHATLVRGLVLPVPKEIFRTFDEFQSANWQTIKRPEIARWKSRGNEAQIATLLGITIAEGFVAMEAKDSAEVKSIGNSVLELSRGLAVREHVLRRSRSIMEHAENADWLQAREEWDQVLTDLQNGMIEIKSADLAQLVSIAGWMRGTEVLSALVLQNYSPSRSELLRQSALVSVLHEQMESVTGDRHNLPFLIQMLNGMRQIRAIIGNSQGPLSEKSVRDIHEICEKLVGASSRRPSESS